MNKHQIKTDHSFFEEKVRLRIESLPDKNPVKVLDLFSGNGLLWEEIQRRIGREIVVLRVDRERGKKGAYLIGDNRKFNFDFSEFDVVDLDAYGCPFSQMERIFMSDKKPKVIFLTFIQSIFGSLPLKMLSAIGYPPSMVKRCPTLFYRDGQTKLLQYLALRGVQKCRISCTPDKRKTYASIEFC
jgi:hypothetical protein